MSTPAVSVIIASYNYEHYLGSALQSVLDQTWKDFEVLVIDDGSKDASVALAEKFAKYDSRIRVLRHPDGNNHGLPATLKLGIAQATGHYIAFLESDDMWTKECLQHRFEALEKSDAKAVFNAVIALPMPGADTTWFDTYVPRILKEHKLHLHKQSQKDDISFSLATALLIENKIPTFSCIMVERNLLIACDMLSPVPRWLDWWLWVQIAQKTMFVFIPTKDTIWRLHSESFNHKISFWQYLNDGSAIWTGFRKQLEYEQSIGKQAKLFLRCPFWLRLCVRILMITRECGVSGVWCRIKVRLKTLKKN